MKRTVLFVGLCWLFCGASVFSQDRPRQTNQSNTPKFFDRLDKNKDGFLDASELPQQLQRRMKQLDTNKDGRLSKSEVQTGQSRSAQSRTGQSRSGGSARAGEINTRPARGERKSDSLKVGDMAPDFTLSDPTGERQVTLSSFRGDKPVVLIFGSHT